MDEHPITEATDALGLHLHHAEPSHVVLPCGTVVFTRFELRNLRLETLFLRHHISDLFMKRITVVTTSHHLRCDGRMNMLVFRRLAPRPLSLSLNLSN